MSITMYRLPLSLALCLTASMAAPQSSQHLINITHVTSNQNESTSQTSSRESNIENIPLTISGNINKVSIETDIRKENASSSNYPDKKDPIINLSENDKPENNTNVETIDDRNESKTNEENNLSPTEISTDQNLPINVLPDPNINEFNTTDYDASESKQSERIATASSNTEGQTDTLALESRQTDKRIKTDTTTPTYEENITNDDELATDGETTVSTEVEEVTKAPLPRFLPKLSHFGKSTFGSPSKNLIGAHGKRKFRSKCKCEKIWNCVKLQISVPRCPDEYFLCCS